MHLERGFALTVAPRFHLPGGWPDRLRVNAGVEAGDGYFFPRADWRVPAPEELALLAGDDGAPAAPDGFRREALSLFHVPEHLRRRWWDLAARQDNPAGIDAAAFQGFLRDVVDFCRFKGLPLLPTCAFDVVATAPGRPSTRVDAAAGRLAGLAFDLPPTCPVPPAEGTPPRPLGAVNLGDEATSLVLLNLPAARLQDRLGTVAGAPGGCPTLGELARRFLTSFREYPLVRVLLRPGDGYWLPAGGVITDGYTMDKQEPDVLLLIRQAGCESQSVQAPFQP
jgi:hypothetical protein